MAVRRPVVRLWIASTRARWSVVGGWIDRGEAAERDDADLGLAPSGSSTKLDRRVLGRLESGRRDVRRAHAARDVDREDDRRLVRRHAQDHRGPAERDTSAATPAAKQCERQVAPDRARHPASASRIRARLE